MYGSDSSQAAALAATGSGLLGAASTVLASGVLLLAGVTLVTIAMILRHRARQHTDG